MCWRLTVWTKFIIFRWRTIWVIKHIKSAFKLVIFFGFSTFLTFFVQLSPFLTIYGTYILHLSLWVFLLPQDDESNERGSSRMSDHNTWHWRRGSFFFNRSSSKSTVDLSQIFNFFKSMFFNLNQVAET